VALALVGLVALVYARVLGHEFVNYDDDRYVTANARVVHGLTPTGFAWALSATHAANWHPLTWLSHMLDVELYGLDAAGHHLTSVALHAANAVLLLLALHALTGAFWQSAVVAALFAVHPLRVESVAWIAERKDVLSGLCWMLTLGAYARYVRRPGWGRYLVLAVCFAAGLMAKPMLVTLPCVLLLLDAWPLGRLGSTPVRRHVAEKLPLLALSAASAAVTVVAQRHGGALQDGETWSATERLTHAAVAYVLYLWKTVWPARLACFYPHPAGAGGIPISHALGAAALLGLATFLALRARCRQPWLLFGWLWFLGTLVPVIGFVQVGSQAMADRYAYLPLVGVYVAVVWGVAAAVASRPGLRRAAVAAATAVIAALALATVVQAGRWANSRTLFEHALAVTDGNYVACNNLGSALLDAGDAEHAAAQFRAALEIRSEFAPAHNNLGLLRVRAGDPAGAVAHFERAVALDPRFAEAHNNLGAALQRLGRLEQAARHFERALDLEADHGRAHNNLGVILESRGDLAGAVEHYETALRLLPDFAEAHSNLGNVFLARGDLARARARYEAALAAQPDFAEAHNNLAFVTGRLGEARIAVAHYRRALALRPDLHQAASGLAWILATHADAALRDGREALRWAEHCARATRERDAFCLECVAAAHAERGDFALAVTWQERAVALAPGGTEPRVRLEAYRAGRPHRQP
jgi:Flp pilus assembly protein TadD